MKTMKLFLDTHDRTQGSFPAQLSKEEFKGFYAQYEQACYEENVVPLRLHVGLEEGRAFCLNMAPDVEAVQRAHNRVGLPYDSIIEVSTATPGDIFFEHN